MRALLALALLTFVLAGCSSDDNGSTTAATTGAGTSAATTTTAAPTGGGTVTTTITGGPHVDVLDNRFDPASLSVDTGTTVSFHNDGDLAHTVTIHRVGDAATTWVHDEEIAPDAETEYTFDTETTYHVWCRFHGQMTSGMAMVVTAT